MDLYFPIFLNFPLECQDKPHENEVVDQDNSQIGTISSVSPGRPPDDDDDPLSLKRAPTGNCSLRIEHIYTQLSPPPISPPSPSNPEVFSPTTEHLRQVPVSPPVRNVRPCIDGQANSSLLKPALVTPIIFGGKTAPQKLRPKGSFEDWMALPKSQGGAGFEYPQPWESSASRALRTDVVGPASTEEISTEAKGRRSRLSLSKGVKRRLNWPPSSLNTEGKIVNLCDFFCLI